MSTQDKASTSPAPASERELREALQAGKDLVESAFAHVSHGGPTRADAEKWIKQAERVLAQESRSVEQSPRANNAAEATDRAALQSARLTVSLLGQGIAETQKPWDREKPTYYAVTDIPALAKWLNAALAAPPKEE